MYRRLSNYQYLHYCLFVSPVSSNHLKPRTHSVQTHSHPPFFSSLFLDKHFPPIKYSQVSKICLTKGLNIREFWPVHFTNPQNQLFIVAEQSAEPRTKKDSFYLLNSYGNIFILFIAVPFLFPPSFSAKNDWLKIVCK